MRCSLAQSRPSVRSLIKQTQKVLIALDFPPFCAANEYLAALPPPKSASSQGTAGAGVNVKAVEIGRRPAAPHLAQRPPT